jgi:hypothetical protein
MKEPAKEITAEEFLKSKQIISYDGYPTKRTIESNDAIKALSLKEREVIKEAIEKIIAIKNEQTDALQSIAFEIALIQARGILESMLNPATNGEDKGE